MRLRKWVIRTARKDDDIIYYLKGYVYGHHKPNCRDGTYVHTSAIISAELNGETLGVKTKHSLYLIEKSEMDAIISLDTVKKFCEKFLGGNTDFVEAAQKKHAEFMMNSSLISSGMLYLQLAAGRDNFFAGALFCDTDGTSEMDYAVVHVGMFEDSVMLINSKVCWFNRSGGVEFYKTLYYALAFKRKILGYIRNVGVAPITVTFSFGDTVTIMPDELYEVKAPGQENAEQ